MTFRLSAWFSDRMGKKRIPSSHTPVASPGPAMWEEILAPAGRQRGGACLSPAEAEEIAAAIGKAQTKLELLRAISGAAARFSVTDLEAMMKNFEEKTRDLDPAYRRLLLPRINEYIFGSYHALMLLCTDDPALEDGPVRPSLGAYAAMVQEACRRRAQAGKPLELYFLKYLLAAFTMYVLEQPAHPVGTPFPGGLAVYREGDSYYCPVRDKSDDIAFSLCPFCPARQDTGARSLHGRDADRRIERLGTIEKSRRDYHG
ncbi:MAG TPA: DUF2115 domain-containing protein [Methanofollis liminatans]|uniref:UPF0305 protein ENN52_03655 n=1 Tax=Methanofollis liminatans TaxID=2201 RepID=A0A831LQT4_9EURY|nr:DUF2115 domain-containing protein [Methanofollis liminatans]